jgi:hypothetical protein
MNSHTIPDELISKFCTTILPDFHKIMKNLEELDHTLSPHDFAMHLMELGREQMSEVADPSEQDVELMSRYIESLDHDNAEEAFFAAFAGGCIMGLVIINKVAPEDFGRALRLIEDFAQKKFK